MESEVVFIPRKYHRVSFIDKCVVNICSFNSYLCFAFVVIFNIMFLFSKAANCVVKYISQSKLRVTLDNYVSDCC